MVDVRSMVPEDADAWRRLWTQYCNFYDTDVPAAVTDATLSRLLDPSSGLVGRVAVVEGRVVGFSASVLHAGTWTPAPICYLEDLFVAEDMRGKGIGGALIEDLIALGNARGWSRLYWHTRADNLAARSLYDHFVAADDFVRYRMFLD